jgi:hypothetical protein
MICIKFELNWTAGSEEKNFQIIFSDFLLFRYYLPLGKRDVLHLYNSEFPLPKDDLCQLWLKLACWFWRRRFLKISVNFYSFAIIFPWGKGTVFICTILNSLYLKMICANFGWNWPSGSEEDF